MSVLRHSRRVVTLDTVANNPAIVESLGMKALLPLIAQLENSERAIAPLAVVTSPREDEQDAAAGLASTAAAMIH